MHLSRKARVAGGIGIAAVIIAGVVVMSSTQSVPPRCHPKLIEHADESFELVEVKTKHYSDIAYWSFGNFRGRAILYSDKVLATLRLRKRTYWSDGPYDVVCITFRAKNLDSFLDDLALLRDDKGSSITLLTCHTRYDPKTRTGVVEVLLPKTPTNFAGRKLYLTVPTTEQLNANRTYAVFSL
jgi:hypothetical protein